MRNVKNPVLTVVRTGLKIQRGLVSAFTKASELHRFLILLVEIESNVHVWSDLFPSDVHVTEQVKARKFARNGT